MDLLTFTPPGPVAAAFMEDRSPVSAIMGPIGSGKTSAALMRILRHAIEQPVSPRDGERHSRWVVVRDTYRRMGATVLQSWHKRVPRTFGKFTDGGMNAPSVHRLRFQVPGRGVVNCEVIFAAIGDNDVEDFCRGFEVTGAYVNELDLMAPEILDFLSGRTGRYPDMTHGGVTWHGVFADFNAPDTDNWCYRDFFEEPRDGYAVYVQPGGLEPGAENVANLPAGYYQAQIRGKPDWYVRRMIHNQFGYSREGKPVYPEFRDSLHVASEALEPIRSLPLILGGDAGLSYAIAITQRRPDGRWLVLDEVVGEGGATKAGEHLNRVLGSPRYRDCRVGSAWADPAGAARASTDERSWIDVLSATTKIRFRPAPSNSPLLRQEAVRAPLGRLVDGQPGLLLSPTCRMLRKGFNSGYRFKRVQGAPGRYHDEPEKNEYSHPHDALQYALLGGGEYVAVTSRAGQHRQALAVQEAVGASDYDPLRW